MIVHAEASREISEAAEWYAERSATLGQRFRFAVADALEAIEAAPRTFPRAHDEPTMAQAWVAGFPFRVVFFLRERDGEACVLSVHHAKRRPGFWRGRIAP